MTIRAKPTGDAVPSPWMSPPAVARRLADACRSSVHVYTSQVHIPFDNNETPSANALQRVKTCCSCQPHEVKVLVDVSPSTEDPPAGSPRLAVCHLLGTCVARRVTDVSIQFITDSLVSRPNTLRPMSPEAVTPPRFHTQLEGRPSVSSSSDLEPPPAV